MLSRTFGLGRSFDSQEKKRLDDTTCDGGARGGGGGGGVDGDSGLPSMRPPKAPLGVNVNRTTGQQTISVLKVYLNNGEFRSVKCGDATDVKGIIHLLCGQLHPSALPLEAVFALRLRHAATGELQWLHRDTTLHQVLDKYLPKQSLNDWRFELRVRYLLANLDDFQQRDRVTFTFFYEQVKNDYLKIQDGVDVDLAITLCCLEIRRFYKDVSQLSIDKKSTALEFLEREVGLDRFLPSCILLQHKAKALRKMILSQFKSVVRLSESQCMLQFLRSVKQVVAFDREVFACQLGTGWTVSVELVISCEQGIGFATDARGPLRPVGQFAQVQNIETIVHEGDSRALVRLRVAGAAEPLSVSCESLRVAEAIADLVDGYCRLVHSTSVSYWTRKELKAGERSDSSCSGSSKNDSEQVGLERSTDDNHPPRYRRSSSKPRSRAHEGTGGEALAVGQAKLRHSEDYAEIVDDEGDYSSTTRDLELDRTTLTLGEVIGQGQFGAVHRGEWRAKDGTRVPVAIKTCNGRTGNNSSNNNNSSSASTSSSSTAKLPDDPQGKSTFADPLAEHDGADKLLDEAHTMKQLDHPHIIRLVGTCSTSPVWIVMELARYGELREFLQRHRERITLPRQLLWSRQLASALCYIQQKGLVHRDVAARNVLVASRDCVKLADFGLSRELGHAAEYTASRGKLPIKWMAPESINFRRFTSASDVWMFGVCVWEILSLGVKPFQGVKNSEVVARLEDGERLPLPAGCPPRLYSILSLCWSYDPAKRPPFTALKDALLEIYNDERAQAETNRRELRRNNTLSWGSDGSDGSDEPPPKPARPASEHRNFVCDTPTPPAMTGGVSTPALVSSATPLAPATYIVAETPEVLARLMRENDGVLPPAWAYVAPASPTNTFAVGGHANTTLSSLTSFDAAERSGSLATDAAHKAISPSRSPTVMAALSQHQQQLQQQQLQQQQQQQQPAVALDVTTSLVVSSSSSAGIVGSPPLSSPINAAFSPSLPTTTTTTINNSSSSSSNNNSAFHAAHLQQQDTNPPPPPAPKTPPPRGGSSGLAGSGGGLTCSGLTDDRDLLEKRLLEIKLREQQREVERDQRWLSEQPLPFGAPARQPALVNTSAMTTTTTTTSSGGAQAFGGPARSRHEPLGGSSVAFNGGQPNGIVRSPVGSPHPTFGSTAPGTSMGACTAASTAVASPSTGSSAGRYGEGEPIYEATTSVVRAVMRLSEGIRAHQVDAYVELVRQTGLALRGLLAAVDALAPNVLAAEVRTRRVEPAQRVLSSDMASLVSAVKLAVQRPADSEQRRAMLAAAHSLAVDAKSLLDIVDGLRTAAPAVRGAAEGGGKGGTPTTAQNAQEPGACAPTHHLVSTTAGGITTPPTGMSAKYAAPMMMLATHSRSGSQSEAGSTISGERALRSECSTPRSSTPTSFRSESLPRSTSASYHTDSQGEGHGSLRSGTSTPGLGPGLSRGSSHAESVGSLPRMGKSTFTTTTSSVGSSSFSGFSTCAGGGAIPGGGSLPRGGGFVAGRVEAINSGSTSRNSPLPSPLGGQNSPGNTASSNIGSPSSTLPKTGTPSSAFVFPPAANGSPLSGGTSGGGGGGRGVSPMCKQNSTSSLGSPLDGMAGGNASLKMISPETGDVIQYHHSNRRKISTGSFDEHQMTSVTAGPHSGGVLAPRKPPLAQRPPLPPTTATGIYDNP